MKIRYDPETDYLYIWLRPESSVESEEIADGFVVDFDERDQIVGIEVDHASERLDLTCLEAPAFPLRPLQQRQSA